MKKITFGQLENALTKEKSATFVQLKYVSTQQVNKRGNVDFIEYPIIKCTDINVTFNGSYENAVNNRLAKKGLEKTFVAQGLPWGEWKIANKIITHNDKTYIRFYLHRNSNSKVEYWYNGELLTGERLAAAQEFMPKRTESVRQSDAGLDMEEQSKPFTIAIENIRNIKMQGVEYEVIK